MRWAWGVAEAGASADAPNRVGVFGASSLVGRCLLPRLGKSGARVAAFSRSPPRPDDGAWEWRQLGGALPAVERGETIHGWISLAPIWVLPDYFELLEAHGARRIVVLSSTSIFTKQDSNDPQEKATAQRLANAEKRVVEWAQSRNVQWVILRPTLIYGLGQDKNIAEIARFIRRFGFFPLFGLAQGLRQPVHAGDVAAACLAALQQPEAANRAYNISGGETLSYRAMAARVAVALGRCPRFLQVPLWTFRLALMALRRLPRYRLWSIAMAERMCTDQVFNHADAARDLDFKPRAFSLSAADLPQ